MATRPYSSRWPIKTLTLTAAAVFLTGGLLGCTDSTSGNVSLSAEQPPTDDSSPTGNTPPPVVDLRPREPAAQSADAGVVADPDTVTLDYTHLVPEEWGTHVTGVVTSVDSSSVALTLDACGGDGGDGYDQELIDGLIEREVPATLFLNSRWINTHTDLTRQLAQNPLFEVANHGTEHLPLSVVGESAYDIAGTKSPTEVVAEVWGNHQLITEVTGSSPRYFRSGTAHYDEVSVSIVQELGEHVAGFSINADGGATLGAAQVREQVASAEPGDIILAHMNQPAGETAEGLLDGVDDLLASGVSFSFLD